MSVGGEAHPDPTPTLAKVIGKGLVSVSYNQKDYYISPSTPLMSVGGFNQRDVNRFVESVERAVLAHFGCSSEAELMELIVIGRAVKLEMPTLHKALYARKLGRATNAAEALLAVANETWRGSALSVAPEATT